MTDPQKRIQKNIITLLYNKPIDEEDIWKHLKLKENLNNKDPKEVVKLDVKIVRIKFTKKTDCTMKTFFLPDNTCDLYDDEKENFYKANKVESKKEVEESKDKVESKKEVEESKVKESKKEVEESKVKESKKEVEESKDKVESKKEVEESKDKLKLKKDIKIELYNKSDNVSLQITPKIVWRKWQQTLFDQIKESNKRKDGRSVIWYYDYQGGTGKTFFSEHFPGMCKKKVTILDSKMVSNMQTLFETYKKQTHPQAFIINISNTKSKNLIIEDSDNLYENLELYSDYFRDSFFIVFSNTFPMLDGLSMNRWILRRSPKIGDVETKDCIELDGRKIVNRDTFVKRVYNNILLKQSKKEMSEEYLRLMKDKEILGFYLKKIFDKKNNCLI